MPLDLASRVVPAHRRKILACCFVFAVVVALLDAFVLTDVSFGILYMVPLLVSALFLPRWQVFVLALAATVLREQFRPDHWGKGALTSVSMGFFAFTGCGLFVAEMVGRRRHELESVKRLEQENALRREAEDEGRVLIQSSLAAILTIDPEGRIELANDAARRLLGFGSETPEGEKIGDYLPMLADFLKSKRIASLVRTMVEGRGRRRNGESFFAQMWLSSYNTAAGPKLAVVFADASEQLRDREELGLRQLLMNSRIIVGAVSHEIRNLAAAAGFLHENIGKSSGVGDSEDFQALGRLIEAMRKLSSSEVPASAEALLTGVDLHALLQELQIVVASGFRDSGVDLKWEVANGLPFVRADHSGLLQVFLNLVQNSRRALDGKPDGCVTIAAYQLGGSVVVHFSDNGSGIASMESLFQPFQPGATSTGLGLYVSRAIIRTYGGELQYIKKAGEGRFLIELPAMAHLEARSSG
jgi:PAS domain S-box-containing protein